jgi:hypothetical protein
MNKEDIIRMAQEAGIDPHDMCEDPRIAENSLERFAAIVAAAKDKEHDIEKQQSTEEPILQWLADNLNWDGHGYWLPDMCVREREWGQDYCPPPSKEDVRRAILGDGGQA